MRYMTEFVKINNQLIKVSQTLNAIDQKVNDVLTIHNSVNLKIDLDVLSLPQHLQQTILALNQIGRGTASDVAAKTGKARTVESAYLNQLVTHQWVTKVRNSRRESIFCLRNLK